MLASAYPAESIAGYTVTDTRHLYEKIPHETCSDKDIRDMSMQEYSVYRRKMNYGASAYAPSDGLFGGTPFTHEKSAFDKWQENRDLYIAGKITDITFVTRYVREDEDRYDEIALGEDSGLHKHGFDWGRWAPWRWLVAWFYRRDLGWPWHRQDDSRTARR